MEILGQTVHPETVKRVVENLFLPEPQKRPLVTSYYSTYLCNADCDWCSQKEEVTEALSTKAKQELPKQKRILDVIRGGCPNIYFLGGEPTADPNIVQLLQYAEELEFDSISLNTNGIIFVPELLDHVDNLVISLHGATAARNAQILRIQPKKGEAIDRNIRRYVQERNPQKTKIIINKVITATDIEDAQKIAEFCKEQGIQFNPAPMIQPDNKPDAGLVGNPKYLALIDWLLAQDQSFLAVPKSYLVKIREFEPFACTPQVMPGVKDTGEVIVPCPNVDSPQLVNIMEVGDLNRAIQLGRERFGTFDPAKECPDDCHKTCYVNGTAFASFTNIASTIRDEIRARTHLKLLK